MPRKRYAIVGTGSRHAMFRDAILKRFSEHCELVALCDSNEGRVRLSDRWIAEAGHPEVPTYSGSEFDRLVAETKPDVIVVTTRDSFHDRYIVRAMELGCDVVTEKPMTIDAERCTRIVDAQKKTGRDVRVTFNYRYSPARTQVKDLLMSGVIGRVISVDFHWLLDTSHGADYFRRWHRNKGNSGGLMVHKATHHFDLVNWWISSVPETVFASGAREFYTPETAERYGLSERGERCLGCPEKEKCRFHLDLARGGLKELYLDNEEYDGYFRDRCVFSEEIDIEDTMNLVVRYRNGVHLSYSLNAFEPKEGLEIRFNGTRGRLEHTTLETSYVSGTDGQKVHETIPQGTHTLVFPHFENPYPVDIWQATGGHGGGDDPLLESVFLPEPPEDRYHRAASFAEGAYSILTGVAANRSMATGSPVEIGDLVKGIPEPDFTEMPEW